MIKKILKNLSGFSKKTFLFGLIIGSFISFFATRNYIEKKEHYFFDQIYPIRNTNQKYHFTNPLLGYNIPNNKELNEFKPLEKTINSFISEAISKDKANKISVYFRDLNKGRWMGVNEDEQYDPASMLKVVIMMAYYKQAENNAEFLTKKIIYTKALSETVDLLPFQTPSTLNTGQSYSLDELISAMIINSDNGAKNALLANIDDNSLNEVYSDLGIAAPEENKNYIISAKAYSMFFRTLYNSTYLNDDYSEKALELLTRANFSEGLVAGMPNSIKTAQKFGEKVLADDKGSVKNIELHDCGIVYEPKNPYILCVMTTGQNLNSLTEAIKNISSLVYNSASSNYKN